MANIRLSAVVGDAHKTEFNPIYAPINIKIGDVVVTAHQSQLKIMDSRLYEPYPNDQIRSGRYCFEVDDEREATIMLTFKGRDSMLVRDEILKIYEQSR
jgi:hypothetical protein